MPANRIGVWAAYAVTAVGLLYAVSLCAGFALYGLSAPIVDPLLAIMEILTMVSALFLLVIMSALHVQSTAARMTHRNTYSVIALACMIAAVTLTLAVHFVELTALRQLGSAGIVWPSIPYALELLAWNPLLGLSLLFAALAIEPLKQTSRLRGGLFLCGALCVAGTIGPAIGNMRWQFVGVFGYAVVLPIVTLEIAKYLRRENAIS